MAELIKSITKKEWRLLGILALTVIVVTTIPLVYGWLVRPPGSIFVGIHFSNLNDWIVYYSYLEQARQGSLLFDNLFTAENQTPMFNIFWISVGILAKIFNLSPILTFNLVRILLIPIFYFVAYLFISYIFKDVRKRQVALLLLSFSAGLGFFLLGRIVEYPTNHALGQFNWPIDLWVPEAFTFLTLYYSPHFIASLTLILSVFFLSLIYVEKRQFFYSIWTGILALILFFFHPFHVLTVFGVIFFYFLILIIKNREQLWPLFRHYVVLLIFSAPAIYYYFYLLSTDFVIRQKALQNLCPTPPPWLTVVGYGLLLVFGLVGFCFLIKHKGLADHKMLFIMAWVLVQFFLIYAPVNYQRRLTEGLHFPLVILATVGLCFLYSLVLTRKNRLSKILFNQRFSTLFLLIFLFSGSIIFSLVADFYIYNQALDISYVDKRVIGAAAWLKTIGRDEIIFNAADNKVNIVPAFSGRRVYVGHGVETLNFSFKNREVAWFFQKNRDQESEKKYLKKRGIDYIFYSDLERGLGSYNPGEKNYLNEVYSNSSVKIYEVL